MKPFEDIERDKQCWALGKDEVPLDWLVLGACLQKTDANGFKMTLDQFRQSLSATEPPSELSLALAGLWWDAKGDWRRAHESAQQDEGPDGSWVHAYLHRKEGDHSNAAYWYSRAGKPVCREPLDAERIRIVTALLG